MDIKPTIEKIKKIDGLYGLCARQSEDSDKGRIELIQALVDQIEETEAHKKFMIKILGKEIITEIYQFVYYINRKAESECMNQMLRDD